MFTILILLCGMLILAAPGPNTYKVGGLVALIIITVLCGMFGVVPMKG